MKITNMQDISNADKSVKMVIFGGFGIGKTSLLKTLEEPTLCLDFEAGLLSVQDWCGDVLAVQTWEEARLLRNFLAC
jgi:replication-associated recombination protein RarA